MNRRSAPVTRWQMQQQITHSRTGTIISVTTAIIFAIILLLVMLNV